MTAHAHHAERYAAIAAGNNSITLQDGLFITFDKDNLILKWPHTVDHDLLIEMAELPVIAEGASLFLLNDSSVNQTILVDGESYIVTSKSGFIAYAFDSDGVRELWVSSITKPIVVP